MKVEKVIIKNKKKERLVGDYYKNNSETLIIICHGLEYINNYPDNQLQNLFNGYFVALGTKTGASVFSFDFRGHGESDGKKVISLRNRSEDIKTVVDYFSSNYKDIVLYGFSFGAMSVVIEAAKDSRVRKVIVINGFLSFTLTHLNLIQFRNIFFHILFHPSFIFEIFYWVGHFHIEKITVPTLIICAESDAVAGSVQSKYFYKKLHGSKKLVLLPGNDHMLKAEIDNLPRIIGSWIREQNKKV
jgi:alpha-beta hydrolase superfamily lysophospholipase